MIRYKWFVSFRPVAGAGWHRWRKDLLCTWRAKCNVVSQSGGTVAVQVTLSYSDLRERERRRPNDHGVSCNSWCSPNTGLSGEITPGSYIRGQVTYCRNSGSSQLHPSPNTTPELCETSHVPSALHKNLTPFNANPRSSRVRLMKTLKVGYKPETLLLTAVGRVQLKCDGTRWQTGGEVKGKLVNGVGSQYSSHYLETWCIQHYYRWCAHLGCQ
jgi:hypothetical protein